MSGSGASLRRLLPGPPPPCCPRSQSHRLSHGHTAPWTRTCPYRTSVQVSKSRNQPDPEAAPALEHGPHPLGSCLDGFLYGESPPASAAQLRPPQSPLTQDGSPAIHVSRGLDALPAQAPVSRCPSAWGAKGLVGGSAFGAGCCLPCTEQKVHDTPSLGCSLWGLHLLCSPI